MTIFLFIVGIALLIVGAEILVRGAARIAAVSGISPLVIGLTVVAFGTSSPEMAVSVGGGLSGEADVALGNVVGSNIFNILFVLGLCAIITPLVVSRQLVRLDVPLVIAASVLTILLALDGEIGRIDGIILFTGIVAYVAYLIWKTRRDSSSQREPGPEKVSLREIYSIRLALYDFLFIVGGLALLVVGAQWLVDGAVEIAETLGVSELIIGLTIISAGTSLPEVATSVIASLRGERDIAVGNAIGSSLFNLLAVLGLTGIVAPDGIAVADSVLRFDLPVMTAVAVASLPVFFTGYTIARWEGWVFFGYYIAYVAYLIMNATEYYLLPAFSSVMLLFVTPITALTLAVLTIRALRQRREEELTESR